MTRTILLFIPSTLIVTALVLHSLRTRGRRETLFFFLFAFLFGVLRGNIIWWITTIHFGGRFPYIFTNRLIGVFHDALQADIGWILTLYVGYTTAEWFLRRFPSWKDSFFHILALSGLFAVCLSYAVESSAMAMGWWNWNLSTKSRFFMEVPMAGIAAWFSVPVDFLTPFLLLVRGSRRLRPWGIAALGIFPLHMLAHLSNSRIGALLPLTPFNLFYWVAAMATLAMPFLLVVRLAPSASAAARLPAGSVRSRPRSSPPAPPAEARAAANGPARAGLVPRGIDGLIPLAVAVVIVVLLAADLAVASRPALLPSVVPLVLYTLLVYLPLPAWSVLGMGTIAWIAWGRSMLFALAPGLLGLLFTWQARAGRSRVLAFGVGIPLLLTIFFYRGAVEQDKIDRLYAQFCTRAAALAQQGDLDGAAREYDRATALKPESIRAWEESGLVHWKRKDLDRAEAAYREVLRRLPISPETWNSLGNVYLMRGDQARALESYRQALRYDPKYGPAQRMIEQITGASTPPRTP